MSQDLSTAGKYMYLAAIAGIGAVHLFTGNFPTGLIPMPEHLAHKVVFAWICGTLMIIAAFAALIPQERRAAYICLMAILFLFFIYPNLVKSIGDIHNPNQWTATFEMLSLFCGVCIFRSLYKEDTLIVVARIAFGLALLVFGLLHILYFDYIQTLIPAWIPFPKFWGWVVPLMFFATATSMIFHTKLVAVLFGLMFLLWVLLVHLPRAISTPRIEPEWTSLFVALAMSGIGFMLTGRKKDEQKIPLKVLSFYRSNKSDRQ